MRVEMGRTLNFLGTESHKRDMDYHWGMGACRWFGTRSFIVRSTGAENLQVLVLEPDSLLELNRRSDL